MKFKNSNVYLILAATLTSAAVPAWAGVDDLNKWANKREQERNTGTGANAPIPGVARPSPMPAPAPTPGAARPSPAPYPGVSRPSPVPAPMPGAERQSPIKYGPPVSQYPSPAPAPSQRVVVRSSTPTPRASLPPTRYAYNPQRPVYAQPHHHHHHKHRHGHVVPSNVNGVPYVTHTLTNRPVKRNDLRSNVRILRPGEATR